jgi:hypothetical protein
MTILLTLSTNAAMQQAMPVAGSGLLQLPAALLSSLHVPLPASASHVHNLKRQ